MSKRRTSGFPRSRCIPLSPFQSPNEDEQNAGQSEARSASHDEPIGFQSPDEDEQNAGPAAQATSKAQQQGVFSPLTRMSKRRTLELLALEPPLGNSFQSPDEDEQTPDADEKELF